MVLFSTLKDHVFMSHPLRLISTSHHTVISVHLPCFSSSCVCVFVWSVWCITNRSNPPFEPIRGTMQWLVRHWARCRSSSFSAVFHPTRPSCPLEAICSWESCLFTSFNYTLHGWTCFKGIVFYLDCHECALSITFGNRHGEKASVLM